MGGGQPLLGYYLGRYAKRLALLGLILLSVLFSLNSSTLKWSWSSQDADIRYYRYQLNGEEDGLWTVVDSSVNSALVESTQEDNVFYLQASSDGVTWSLSSRGVFTSEKEMKTSSPFETAGPVGIRVTLSPYTLTFYSFVNGRDISKARSLTSTVYGFSSALEFDWMLGKFFRLFGDAEYSLSVKKETIIPGGRNVHYIRFGCGLDFTFGIAGRSSIYTGASIGCIFHINNRKANIALCATGRIGYDYALTAHIVLGVRTEAVFSLLKAKNSLNDSLTILIHPVRVSLTYLI